MWPGLKNWIAPGRVTAVTAAVIGYIVATPALQSVIKRGPLWPVSSQHAESTAAATYGRWWVEPPHRFLADAFSGDFPTFYNYLGDAGLNALSALLDWPPAVAQVALWAPLLAVLFFLLNRWCLKIIFKNDWVAIWGAALLSLFADSGVARLVKWGVQPGLGTIMHVPYHALPLANAQSVGWVLSLPVLTAFYLAREQKRLRWVVLAGVFLGVLFQTHTLTFINAVFVQCCYLGAKEDRALSGGNFRKKLWGGLFLLLFSVFVVWVLWKGVLSLSALVVFLALAMLINFVTDRNPLFYLVYYGSFLLVSAPYLSTVVHSKPFTNPGPPNPQAASPWEVFLFYFFPWVCAGALWLSRKRIVWPQHSVKWLGALFLGTGILAFNHYWGWTNHPYRFAINLIFPLAIVSALAVVHLPQKVLRRTITVIFGAFVLRNAWAFGVGSRLYAHVTVHESPTALVLEEVRKVTHPGARILSPPENDYPGGVVQSALILSYSRAPGFIADYRYQLEPERHRNRMALFCWLFPEYPHWEIHSGLRACEEKLDPPAEMSGALSPQARPSMLGAYGIKWAAALGDPFFSHLSRQSSVYGWKIIVAEPGGETAFAKLASQAPPGFEFPRRYAQASAGVSLSFQSEAKGALLIGGYRLEERMKSLLWNGKPVSFRIFSAHWLRAEVSGPGEAQLLWKEDGKSDPRDSIFFGALVSEPVKRGFLQLRK